jgi:lipopolysaccharide transport system permease protein
MRAIRLAVHFAHRDFRNRYMGSFSGSVWAILQPLLQLGIYAFIFSYVFKQRAPGSSELGYVPYLFVAMWPWLAFAESLQRCTLSLQENAGLLTKVPIPRISLVVAPLLATFAVNAIGYFAILVVFCISSPAMRASGIPLAMLGQVALLFFALGFALLLAPLQVFVRDIAPALPQLTQLWMFLSPVFYNRQDLPEAYRGWLDFNPYTAFAEFFRWALLDMPAPALRASVVALTAASVLLAMGYGVFKRLQSHVEDFL